MQNMITPCQLDGITGLSSKLWTPGQAALEYARITSSCYACRGLSSAVVLTICMFPLGIVVHVGFIQFATPVTTVFVFRHWRALFDIVSHVLTNGFRYTVTSAPRRSRAVKLSLSLKLLKLIEVIRKRRNYAVCPVLPRQCPLKRTARKFNDVRLPSNWSIDPGLAYFLVSMEQDAQMTPC